MRTQTWVRWLVAAGAASLVVTGCSKGDKDEPKSEEKRVTISSLMGAPDYENIDYEAQQQEIEELIASCMKQEGWEYTPVQYPDDNFAEYTDEDQLEQIKREGLGVAYWILNPNGDPAATEAPTDEWVDPNQEYVESLTEDERLDYQDSLYGTQEEQEALQTTEVDPETGEEYSTSFGYGAGCQGEAYDAVYGEDPTNSPDYWEAVSEFYDELQIRTESDPRIVELNENWSKCMKDTGHDFADQEKFYDYVYTDLQERATEILGDDYYKDPMEGWSEEQMNEFWETATQEQIDALYKQPELTKDQRTQLEAILDEEIDLGVTEFGCSKEMREKGADIYADIEETYALEHEDELKAIAASLVSGE